MGDYNECMNQILTTLLTRWRDCATKQVVQPNRYAPSPSQDFEALCLQLAQMVKAYDQLAAQMPDGEAKDLLSDMSEQIITSMNLGGCTPITKETSFCSLRHKPVPFTLIEDGTPIRAILRAGVELNSKVLIKAIVKINN